MVMHTRLHETVRFLNRSPTDEKTDRLSDNRYF